MNEWPLDEVDRGDVGDVPQSPAIVLDNVHVVGGASIETWGHVTNVVWTNKSNKTLFFISIDSMLVTSSISK